MILAIAPPDWYADNNITLHLGDPFSKLTASGKQ